MRDVRLARGMQKNIERYFSEDHVAYSCNISFSGCRTKSVITVENLSRGSRHGTGDVSGPALHSFLFGVSLSWDQFITQTCKAHVPQCVKQRVVETYCENCSAPLLWVAKRTCARVGAEVITAGITKVSYFAQCFSTTGAPR